MEKRIHLVSIFLILVLLSACTSSSQHTEAIKKEEVATVETEQSASDYQSNSEATKLKSVELDNGFILGVPAHWEVEGGSSEYSILRFISEDDLMQVDIFAVEEDRQAQEERFRTDEKFVPITLSDTEGYVEKKVETVEVSEEGAVPKYIYTYSFNINGKYTLTAGFYAITDRLGDEGIDDVMHLILETAEDLNP
ncbi:TPA: hypothetical protein ACGO4G_000494 [Streptococcus suis]